MRPRVLAYILSCKSKLVHRCVKPDLRTGETDNLPPVRERILRLRLAFFYTDSLSESRKIYASPGPEGLKQREKKRKTYGGHCDYHPYRRDMLPAETYTRGYPERLRQFGA